MQTEENYWDKLFENGSGKSTDNVIDYFNSQARQLAQASNGKVTAILDRMINLDRDNDRLANMTMALQAVVNCSEVGSMIKPRLKDANELYCDGSYAFEIRSNSYRFRLFEFELGALYPLNIALDEGIFNELDSSIKQRFAVNDADSTYTLAVESDDDLDILFKAILNTRKVAFLVKKLFALAE